MLEYPLSLFGPVKPPIMQQLWRYNLDWDDWLPNALQQVWLGLYKQFSLLRDIAQKPVEQIRKYSYLGITVNDQWDQSHKI